MGPAGDSSTSAALERILAGDHRAESNRARDSYRHPKETLLFFGIRPEMTVVEVWQQPYLNEDVGPDTASALDEPARKRAEQLLQDQVGKALERFPGRGGHGVRSASVAPTS